MIFEPSVLAALWSALANPEAQKIPFPGPSWRGWEVGGGEVLWLFAVFGVLSECQVWMETNKLKTISEGTKIDTCYLKASSLRK